MNPDYANELSSLVDNYSSVASELLDLLEIEQQALAQRQFDEIDRHTQTKVALIQNLEQLETTRKNLESQATEGEQQEIRQILRDQLGNLLNNCRESNLVNGGIIELSRQFNQRLLTTLLGVQGEDSSLYDERGENTDTKANHLFAKI